MTPDPLVSVIIPAHNAARWIRDSVSSALNQIWRTVEVIVVDDGSTDDTAAILDSFTDDRLEVIRQIQSGASAARNAGMRVAGGELIQFLDADDELSADKIELQIDALRRSPPGSIASCAWVHLGPDGTRDPLERSAWTVTDPIDWLVDSLLGGGMMQPACWLTPKDVIDRAGPWNEALTLHDDGDFFARVLAQAATNVFVAGPRVLYREHDASLSRHRDTRSAESAFAVCRSRHAVISSRRNDDKARSAIATQYAQFVYEFSLSSPQLAADAMSIIESLGARPAPITGGAAFRFCSQVAGFPAAMRLRSMSSRVLH